MAAGYRTGVSLHSHTRHSKESMSFLEGMARRSRLFDWFIRGQLTKYSERYSDETLTDLEAQTKRMWWTPPLSARQAFQVERKQIEDKLGLRPIVSITDHDNIEAPLLLQVLADNAEAPISVEWTAPYGETYFHIGVHNMHPSWAREMLERMNRFTAAPNMATMRELLRELGSHPESLIVFNHPCWDQAWLGPERHRALLTKFLGECEGLLHALEINGLRSWKENHRVVELAEETGMKLISGGDRHCREPNATLNLTNASTFAEFVAEIRGDEVSQLCVMPHFHDPLPRRIFQGMWDVFQDNPEEAEGRVRWAQRVHRRCQDDSIKDLDDFFGGRDPKMLRLIINTTRFMTSDRMRPAWRRVSIPAEAAL